MIARSLHLLDPTNKTRCADLRSARAGHSPTPRINLPRPAPRPQLTWQVSVSSHRVGAVSAPDCDAKSFPAHLRRGALVLLASVLAGWGMAGPPTVVFEDVAEKTGFQFNHFIGATGSYFVPEIFGSGIAVLDYDGDGDLDVYILQGTLLDRTKSLKDSFFPPPKDHFPGNRLFRNDLIPSGKLSFTDVTEQAGVAGNGGYAMGAAVGDYDNDGRADLFVTNYGRDILYHNNGDGTFADVSKETIPQDESFGSSAAFVDYDRDGFLDLYVVRYNSFRVQANKLCSGYAGGREYCGPGDYRPIPSKLYHNDGHDSFSRILLVPFSGPSQVDGAWADLDGDGLLDLFICTAENNQPDLAFRNLGGGKFQKLTVNQVGAIVADYAVLATIS